jgi:hypothetical protein
MATSSGKTGRYDGLTLVCYRAWSGTALLPIYLPGRVGGWRRSPLNLERRPAVRSARPARSWPKRRDEWVEVEVEE